MGFSQKIVPSKSNVAILSSGRIKSLFEGSVTLFTKEMISDFAFLSFQEGRGSNC